MSPQPADVVVLGSANLDLYARVPAIPAPGETVLAEGPEPRAGGKGLNQAVAAARAGATTTLLAAVGDDDAARVLLGEAEAAGIDAHDVRRSSGPSGTAWIIVRPDGENSIVVLGAANLELVSLTQREQARIASARVLVTQLETPLSAVVQAAEVARRHGTLVILNASPAQAVPENLLSAVDVLIVNEHEAARLGGAADVRTAAARLIGSVGAVVVTLGPDGALVVDGRGSRHIAGVRAQVVDTTGAGDTFAGVLAATLAEVPGPHAGHAELLDHAVARAVVAGALAVEREGAVASIPDAAAIAARQRQLEGAR